MCNELDTWRNHPISKVIEFDAGWNIAPHLFRNAQLPTASIAPRPLQSASRRRSCQPPGSDSFRFGDGTR